MRFRIWLSRLIVPPTHRVMEVDPGYEIQDLSSRTIASDLIAGGDALARGWGCDPAILYNGASRLRELANVSNDPKEGTIT